MKLTLVLLVVLLLASCAAPQQNVVSLGTTMKGPMELYMRLYADGKVSPEQGAQISEAHMTFRRADRVACDLLLAYKIGGMDANPEPYNTALTAAQQSANELAKLLVPLLSADQAIALTSRLKEANAP